MIRTFTAIGLLIAVALPLLDFALFRPGRRALAGTRLPKVERLIYAAFLLAVVVQALSSFGSILFGEERAMRHWALVAHMSVAGLFAVTLTALALLWADQAAFHRQGERRFHTGEKAAFWLTLVAGFVTITSAMLAMMNWFGTAWQNTLLDLHRYSSLALVIFALFHGYRLLVGRTKASAA
jgi:hypothetical protein